MLLSGAVLALLPTPLRAQPLGGNRAPAIHFHLRSAELLSIAYTGYAADPRKLEEDVEWTEENSERLVDWWERQGPMFLQRVSDFAGLAWPYGDIEVYLVRRWPTISIEYPLVLALDAVEGEGGEARVPEDEDVLVLLLAHQLTHYLLDDPEFVPENRRATAYEHPFLSPGNFNIEAMVNWLTYSALEEIWGRARVEEATGDELWRAYNPNHEYVVEELMESHRLSRTAPLADWLADNPQGTEIFGARDTYADRAGDEAPDSIVERERITGTEYGLDLGATYDGEVFVAYVDEASPAARAGVLQGDVLRTIEGRSVGSDVVGAQGRLNEAWEQKREINLSVERRGKEVYLTIEGS